MLARCIKIAAIVSATTLMLAAFGGLAIAADAAVPAGPAAVAAPAPPPVALHGYLQNRLYLGDGAGLEYRVERISVSALAALPSDSNAYVELYYHPWTSSNGLYVESAYYDTGLCNGRVRVGKGRRQTFGIVPAWSNRKTSNYGLVAEAFTQDRIQGVQYMYQKDALEAGIALHTAYRLGIRNIGDIPGDDVRNVEAPLSAIGGHVVPHLCMRDPVSGSGTPATASGTGSSTVNQLSRQPQVSARLGGKWKDGLKAGISYSFSGLDSRDLFNLKAASGTVLNPTSPINGLTAPLGASFTRKSMSILGLDATYKHKCGLMLQGEYYKAEVSNLGYNGWDVLGGYEMANGWKFFVRYGVQNMDTPLTNNPLSWDTQQISLSMVQPLRKGLWLQYEYKVNTEDTNLSSSVANNVGFIELFTGF